MVRKRPTSRFANGIVSAIIVCFFLVHGLLGSLALVFAFRSPLLWVVWFSVGLAAIHVVLSIVTSYQQMTDAEFPPSPRKKRHLLLKWITGGLLAILVVVHVLSMRASGSYSPAVLAILMIALIVALAVHVWVGAKSLLTDVGLSKKLMTPLRVVVCVLAVVYGIMTLMGLLSP